MDENGSYINSKSTTIKQIFSESTVLHSLVQKTMLLIKWMIGGQDATHGSGGCKAQCQAGVQLEGARTW